jgi:hypothetical protein
MPTPMRLAAVAPQSSGYPPLSRPVSNAGLSNAGPAPESPWPSSAAAAPLRVPPPAPSLAAPPAVPALPRARVRRRIPPVSGRALEILGHAIEYLADEYVLASGLLPSIDAHDPQIEAMQILKQANRAIYFECPVIPPWHVRLKARLLGHRPEQA